ncbi:MAG: hypothetical protein VX090_07395, partial [Pseudomonadota bacterium]|nr:hypothetical protein [Pseudomonadota bacterium]
MAPRRTRMPKGWTAPPERLRLHIQNVAPMDLVYKITETRYMAAAAKFPELAARIDVTVTEEADEFARYVSDADVL